MQQTNAVIKKTLLLVGVCFCFTFLSRSQTPTTQGTEFFITYMKNGYRTCNGTTTNEKLKIFVSALESCYVTASNPNTGWSSPATYVPTNGLITMEIPLIQSYNTESEVVRNLGIYVTATKTVSLYISNEATNSFDASFILPTASLSNDYVVQCYTPMTYSVLTCPNNNRSCFVIIATENNTIVDIVPSKLTQGNHPANISFPVTLQRGQTYFVYSNSAGTNGDLSGSRITARDCKKISVFNGNILTTIPYTLQNGADHIFEQAMPKIFLGKNFIVSASLNRPGGDIVRITATENGTQIYKDNVLVSTINAYATYEFIITSTTIASYIETSKPVVVNLYNTTSDYDYSVNGDPSMVWISPVEQQIKDIVFGTFQAVDNSITNHYVNIVTKTADIASMQLDGVNISAFFTPVPGNPTFSYARRPISYATHHLTSLEGFTAHVYGFGSAKGYAYSVGSSTTDLSGTISINGISSLEFEINQPFCSNEDIVFTVNTAVHDSVIWMIDNEIISFQDTVTYYFSASGTYQITNITRLYYANCYGSLFDTVYYTINIAPSYSLYDTIYVYENDLPVQYDSLTITQAGEYEVHFSSLSACDSLVNLTVFVVSLYIDSITISPVNCFGDDDGFAIVWVSGGILPYSYEWSTTPLQTTATASSLVAGIYSVTISDANNYSITASANITQPDSLTLIATPINTTCGFNNGVISTTIFGGTPPYSFLWNDGNTSQYRTDLDRGEYSVLCTDSLGCSTSLEVFVDSLPLLLVSIIEIVQDSCSLSAGSIAVEVVGGRTPYTYQWSTDTANNSIINNLAAGDYSVSVTDADGCLAMISTTLFEYPMIIEADITDDICSQHNGMISLSVSQGNSDHYLINWGSDITEYDGYQATNLSEGSYSIMVSDGTCIVPFSFDITLIPAPISDFIINSIAPYFAGNDISFIDKSQGNIISWRWDFGDSETSNIKNPSHLYQDAKTYTIQLKVKTDYDCIDSTEQEIEIIDYTAIYIPNAFAPYSETNNVFKPIFHNPNPQDYSMKIYDRWGNLLFHSTKIDDGWDGTIHGQPIENPSTYVYVILYKEATNNVLHRRKGSVTLIVH